MLENLLGYFAILLLIAFLAGFVAMFVPPLGMAIFIAGAAIDTFILIVMALRGIMWLISDVMLVGILGYAVYRLIKIYRHQINPMGFARLAAESLIGACTMFLWIATSGYLEDTEKSGWVFAPINWSLKLYYAMDHAGMNGWQEFGVLILISGAIAALFMVLEHAIAGTTPELGRVNPELIEMNPEPGKVNPKPIEVNPGPVEVNPGLIEMAR